MRISSLRSSRLHVQRQLTVNHLHKSLLSPFVPSCLRAYIPLSFFCIYGLPPPPGKPPPPIPPDEEPTDVTIELVVNVIAEEPLV